MLRVRVYSIDGDMLDEGDVDEFPFTVGRSAECDLCLERDGISRRHFEVVALPEGLVINDLGSTNGIFIDGKRVERKLVRRKTTIRVGPYQLEFVPVDANGEEITNVEAVAPADGAEESQESDRKRFAREPMDSKRAVAAAAATRQEPVPAELPAARKREIEKAATARAELEQAERKRAEQAERKRAERERLDLERLAREQAEQVARERAEQAEREKAERARARAEKAERERAEQAERAREAAAERERRDLERIERERAAAAEREWAAKAERERAEKAARAERERIEREQAERERAELAEIERVEAERAAAAEREWAAKAERERAEKAERARVAKAEREKAEKTERAEKAARAEKAERERAAKGARPPRPGKAARVADKAARPVELPPKPVRGTAFEESDVIGRHQAPVRQMNSLPEPESPAHESDPFAALAERELEVPAATRISSSATNSGNGPNLPYADSPSDDKTRVSETLPLDIPGRPAGSMSAPALQLSRGEPGASAQTPMRPAFTPRYDNDPRYLESFLTDWKLGIVLQVVPVATALVLEDPPFELVVNYVTIFALAALLTSLGGLVAKAASKEWDSGPLFKLCFYGFCVLVPGAKWVRMVQSAYPDNVNLFLGVGIVECVVFGVLLALATQWSLRCAQRGLLLAAMALAPIVGGVFYPVWKEASLDRMLNDPTLMRVVSPKLSKQKLQVSDRFLETIDEDYKSLEIQRTPTAE